MPVNAKFLTARAAERRQRDYAHLRLLCWLPLERRGRVFARAPLVPITLRQRLELRQRGNAFFVHRPVLLGDVFQVVWRLHPQYAAPRFGRKAVLVDIARRHFRFVRLWYALGSAASARAYLRTWRVVARCDLAAAKEAIDTFIELAEQDAPGAAWDEHGRPSLAAPDRQASDNLVSFLMSSFAMSHDAALDFPIALANQLYREFLFTVPDGDVQIFAPSDRLLAG